MPSDLYSDAMKEYITLMPAEVVALQTVEFTHSTFIDELGNPLAARFVSDKGTVIGTDGDGNDVYGHVLRLEADAPLSAGEDVQFIGLNFDITLPALEGENPGTMKLGIDNAAGLLSDKFDAAMESFTPIGVNFREYLDNDPTAPTGVFRGLTIGEAESNATRVVMSAGYDETTNRSFPSLIYLPSQYPTLGR